MPALGYFDLGAGNQAHISSADGASVDSELDAETAALIAELDAIGDELQSLVQRIRKLRPAASADIAPAGGEQ